jgi:hypothetical protein
MDPHRFDTLTKILARPGTRRRLFTVLASVPLVGAMTEDLADEATAARRPLDWLFARAARAQQRRQTRRQRHRRELRQERRRQRRDSRNGNGNGNGNGKGKSNNNKRCHAKPDATTCDGLCGDVTNNCGNTVDCGPCACPAPCDDCETCDTVTGTCVADPGKAGTSCAGAACGKCNATGTCEAGTNCGTAGHAICCEAGTNCCGGDTDTPECCSGETPVCAAGDICVAGP